MTIASTTNRYDKYKDSGIEWIGEIPDSWKLVKTGRIFRNIKEIVGEKSMLVERFALTLNGVIKRSKSDAEGLQPEQFNGYQYLRKNQLVFKLIDLENVNTSRVGLCEFEEGMVSPAYIVLCNNNLNNRYYYYYFISLWHNEIFNHLGGDGVRSALNAKDLLAIPTFDISIKEQEAIAGYLDRKCGAIDETIEKQKSVIEKLKEYKQSIITKAVTKGLDKSAPMKDSGIEWIGQIPQHWDSIKLKFCSYIRARLGWKGLKAEEYVEEGYPLLSAFNIVNSKLIFENLNFINQFRYDESPEIKLQTNDILLVKDGAGIGKCAIVENMPIPSTANGSLAVISTNYRLVAKFLYYYFISTIFQAYIDRLKDGMGVPHLFQADLKEIQIVLPKDQEQKNIVEFLDKKCSEIDKTIEDKEKLIEKLVEYKKSLIYECVTGKRKVVA